MQRRGWCGRWGGGPAAAAAAGLIQQTVGRTDGRTDGRQLVVGACGALAFVGAIARCTISHLLNRRDVADAGSENDDSRTTDLRLRCAGIMTLFRANVTFRDTTNKRTLNGSKTKGEILKTK